MIGLKGIGVYLPQQKENIKELHPDFDQKRLEKLGLGSVYSSGNLGATDLAIYSAKEALKKAKVLPQQIQHIIYCQASIKDHLLWQASAKVQKELGAIHATFFDLHQGCSAFVTAIDLAGSMLKTNDTMENILVTTGESWGNITDKRYVGGFFFGDSGASAVVSRNCPNNCVIGFGSIGKGEFHDLVRIEAGGKSGLKKSLPDNWLKYELKATGSSGIDNLKEVNIPLFFQSANIALHQAGLRINEIDYTILPNVRRDLLLKIIRSFGIEIQKTNLDIMEDTGDLGSADAITGYFHMLEKNRIRKGHKVLLITQGIGMTWSAIVIKA